MDGLEEAVSAWLHDPSKEPPSVPDQCAANGWPFGYFWRTGPCDEPPLFEFNPGLAIHKGQLVYCVRRSNYSFGRFMHKSNRYNRTFIGGVDAATMQAGPLVELQSPDDHCEDCRVVSTSMGLLVGGAVYATTPGPDMAQQVMMMVDDQFRITQVLRPVFGGNAHPRLSRRSSEKNWTWFESEEGQLSCVYHHTPHTVFNYYVESNAVHAFSSPPIPASEWGEVRGGTNPVCWQDQWLTIGHCSTPSQTAPWHPHVGRLKRYVALAIRFDTRPPYRITAYTDPILFGSLRSDSPRIHQPAVFPCGLVVDGDIATVAMGLNDRASAWCKINLNDLKWKIQR